MKRIIIIILVLLSILARANAQSPLIPLKIGDQIPDITFKNIRNSQSEEINLSRFKGKLVVLDFWNRWCASCIASFPKMQELQEEFKDKIQIVLVTDDKEEDLKRLFQVSSALKLNRLPMIIGDSILHRLLPHFAVPFHVWIAPTGEIVYMTNGWNTTSTSIKSFLEGRETNIKSLTPVFSKAQIELPLLQQIILSQGSDIVGKTLSYSLITSRSSVEPRTGIRYGLSDSSGRYMDMGGLTLLNDNIIGLFRYAYPEFRGHKSIVILKNPANERKYYPPINKDERGDWISKNTYSYEIKLPSEDYSSEKELKEYKWKYMLSDLERHFRVTSYIEERDTKCYVLYLEGKEDKLKAKGNVVIYEKNNGLYTVRNSSIQQIINIIGINFSDFNGPNEIPVFDETGYKNNIDADLKIKPSISLVELRKELAKFGLGLREEVRPVKCLIIKEI